MKELMTGNEAVARGAYEAGVIFASAYPGTPSTEILENISDLYKNEIYCEWAPNEKVAVEAAIGAAIAGGRALACMKHVGVNVAADPLMTFGYTEPPVVSLSYPQTIRECIVLKMSRITDFMQNLRKFQCWSLPTVRKQEILSKLPMISVKNGRPPFSTE